MHLEAAAICDRGRVREKNEDNLLFNGTLLPEVHGSRALSSKSISLTSEPLFGVFDGMGGYVSGETASFLVADAAHRLWRNRKLRQDASVTLERICEDANQDICDAIVKHNGARMGSTAALLSFSETDYFLCNIGDSPVFRLRDGELITISHEHTERSVYEKVTGKKSDPKQKFRLTQNIGVFPDEFMISPFSCSAPVFLGDIFLLCSDGITDMLDEQTIRGILSRSTDAKTMAKTLYDEAMQAGGKDNITAIVVKVCEKQGLFHKIFR